MAEHLQLTMGTDTYTSVFCSSGITLGEGNYSLIRQFFAKGTDFTLVNNEQLKRAQDLLNDRSRRVLDWEKPDEVLDSVLH